MRGSEAEGGWCPVLSGIFRDVFEGFLGCWAVGEVGLRLGVVGLSWGGCLGLSCCNLAASDSKPPLHSLVESPVEPLPAGRVLGNRSEASGSSGSVPKLRPQSPKAP